MVESLRFSAQSIAILQRWWALQAPFESESNNRKPSCAARRLLMAGRAALFSDAQRMGSVRATCPRWSKNHAV
jgi:hypothetical protein